MKWSRINQHTNAKRYPAAVAFVALFALSSPLARADTDTAPNTSSEPSISCIHRDDEGRFMGWMDYKHCVFSGRTLATANWFDDLFGDWDDKNASLFLNAITEQTFKEGGVQLTRFNVRASADLPNFKKRLRLVVFDDEEENPTSRLFRDRQTQQSAALRWIPQQFSGIQSDFDIGVRGLSPPDFFARLRMRRSWPFWNDYALRASQTFRYGSNKKGSEATQLDVERVLGENTVARWSNVVGYEEKDAAKGLYFGHGLSLSHVLEANRSLSYGVSLDGRSEPNWQRTNYSVWLVWRSAFLRPWLFYEIEPRQTYSRSQKWDPVTSIIFRLEVQFGQR